MENLISIIEERERQFDNKFDVGGFNNLLERASPKEFKDFNRQTILELVEGIEKWAKENKYHEDGLDIIYINDLISLLQPLKDRLKQ